MNHEHEETPLEDVMPSGYYDPGERIIITPVHEGDAPSVNFHNDENIPPLIDPHERLNGYDDDNVTWPQDETPSGNVVGFLFAVIVGAISMSLFLLAIGWRP